ncbi:hypothetical protein PR202_ga12498 [Eleusine coracana subsp. coracana]|uniref:Uncharacterized protein n=1 Tax=Eleusine coracana subsp. coracana TaxID=191504 RepID=A0AAV5CCD1_ELECO|nr:hypothetical protein PR202_ga12498 [Eleusine coracana subsp. coracana]
MVMAVDLGRGGDCPPRTCAEEERAGCVPAAEELLLDRVAEEASSSRGRCVRGGSLFLGKSATNTGTRTSGWGRWIYGGARPGRGRVSRARAASRQRLRLPTRRSTIGDARQRRHRGVDLSRTGAGQGRAAGDTGRWAPGRWDVGAGEVGGGLQESGRSARSGRGERPGGGGEVDKSEGERR